MDLHGYRDYDVLRGRLCMDRLWELCTAKWTLGRVTLDMYAFATAPQVDHRPRQGLEAHRTLVHYLRIPTKIEAAKRNACPRASQNRIVRCRPAVQSHWSIWSL